MLTFVNRLEYLSQWFTVALTIGMVRKRNRSQMMFIIIIIIIIIDKTDAGLNGLCIRDITLICDVMNMYNNY